MRRAIFFICWAVFLLALQFLVEPIFPLGDLRWAVVAVLVMLPPLYLYRREARDWFRRALRGGDPAEDPQPIPGDSVTYDMAMGELFATHKEGGGNVVDFSEEIMDLARTGQLTCWGRKSSAAGAKNNPNPLQQIPEEHWDHYNIDVTRCTYLDHRECCTDMRNADNWRAHSADRAFEDLRVNRAQAQGLGLTTETDQ